MSVTQADLFLYGSANMPTADGTTTGGAVSFSTKPTFVDPAAASTFNYVSDSGSDTATTIALTGRDSTGVIQVETKTLNGTTPVSGTQSFQRLLQGVAGGTTAVGNIAAISNTAIVTGTAQGSGAASGQNAAFITLQAGQGASCAVGDIIRITNNTPSGVQFQLKEIVALSTDTAYVNGSWGTAPTSGTTYGVYSGMYFNLSPNQITTCIRPFYNVSANAAGGGSITFYAKVFYVNNNTTTALTVASILKQLDPAGLYTGSGALNIALTNSLNDTATTANRQTGPASGITAYTSGAAPQTINVPSPQNLPSGNAPNTANGQGIWLQLILAAGEAPGNGFVDLRATGSTT